MSRNKEHRVIRSMTAFASRTGALGAHGWAWEIRSVNGRGLDLRLRLPDGIEGLEAELRKRLSARLARGNVTVNLRLRREDAAQPMTLDAEVLAGVLQALEDVQTRAMEMGITLGQPTAADVLAQRGVLRQDGGEDTPEASAALRTALLTGFDALLEDFEAMRGAEGGALTAALTERVDAIADLTGRAERAAADRAEATRASLRANLARILEETADVPEDRLAQELALIAVKADVSEEIDRLRAHVTAARALLGSAEPVGRKLDFLTQEFNREANTLCSKAGAAALTAIGLDLKAVIDQLREQVQNVE